MQAMISMICILTAAVWIPQTWADIYIWTDEDGVRHISNLNPPAYAEVLLETEEPIDDVAPHRAQQEVERQQAQAREREMQLDRQKAELERRIEETEQKTQEALERAEERLAAAEARYEPWTADRSDTFSTITYFYRPYGFLHYRHKHPGYHRSGNRRHSPSLANHPFFLGAIHLPLGSIGYDSGRYRSPEIRFSRPRPNGKKPGRPHGNPGRRRP